MTLTERLKETATRLADHWPNAAATCLDAAKEIERLNLLLPALKEKDGHIGHNEVCPWCKQTKLRGHAELCKFVEAMK